MATRNEAYLDSSGLIAFLDKSDSFHPLFRRLFAEPPPLVTTALVATECHAWLLRRYDRARALQLLAMIEEMRFLKVLPVGARELHSAVEVLRRFKDQDLTIVDAVGLWTMKARRIRACWSTDFHLGLTGVSLVIHGR
jgi:predicted nucleic acid-binding protein